MDDSQSTGAGMLLAGRYRLGETIGRGGMGRVWRAVDETLHRTVAVKELTAGLYAAEADREVLHRRTQTEARAAARITHPNVVTVHDVLEYDGRPWIVMQYVDGRSLSDAVKDSGTLGAREAARIGGAVLSALRAAHAAGVLHRDVKPANVMLARDGQVLLADFGIAAVEGDASITRTGELIGSVEYLAPERVQGGAPGPASDLWSLGATLYAAVEGSSPYHRESALSTLQAVMEEEAPRPRSAGALAPVIVAMLNRDPAGRPDAAACAKLLGDVAEGRTETVAYPAESRGAPVTSFVTRPQPAATAQQGVAPHQGVTAQHGAYAPEAPATRHGQAAAHQASYTAQNLTSRQGMPAPYGTYAPENAGFHGGSATHQVAHARQGSGAPGQGAGSGPARPRGGTAGARGGSRRRSIALAVVAALVIGGGIGFAVTQFGGGGQAQAKGRDGATARPGGGGATDPAGDSGGSDGSGGSGSSADSVTSSPDTGGDGQSGGSGGGTGTGGGNVPAGWRRVTAPEGFSLWLPKGWRRVQGVGTIDYSPDGDEHFVRISVDTQPDFPTPLDHLKNLEGTGGHVGHLPGYQRLELNTDTYRDQKLAARWKFTWNQDASQGVPGPRTAADLMYVDDADGTEYAIYMSGPTQDWSDAKFSTVLRGWQPPANPAG